MSLTPPVAPAHPGHPAPPASAPNAASRTAVGVAMQRAAHQLLDAPPLLLDDPVAVPLLGEEAVARLVAAPERLQTREARMRRAHVVVRARYAEDRLREAVGRGVAQYLVLGAGLDTFAYRQPDWARALRIVEVDHPASQADKRARLAAAGVAVPANVAYAAVDLDAAPRGDGVDEDPLGAALAGAGVRLDVPLFVSWLGVMMYLEPAAALAVLRRLAALPPDSEVAFTFAPPPPPGVDPRDWPSAGHRTATAGEPWLTFFSPADMRRALLDAGFGHVHLLEPAEAEARYFAGRADGLPAPVDVTIGSARVRDDPAAGS